MPPVFFLAFGIGGTLAVLGGALALGVRHGIDWDHIAAITDITSTSATAQDSSETWLIQEPGVLLSGETGHGLVLATASGIFATGPLTAVAPASQRRWQQLVAAHKRPFFLGTMYALGHGSMVIVLGLLAILFEEILPDWLDPLMERVVGATLVFLAIYLFYSLYRYFRTGGEFRIRSRWMLVFAAVGNLTHRLSDRLRGTASHDHDLDSSQQYGGRTAYGIGLIHGIGAETGTQVLIIGTAVGAHPRGMGVLTLFVFVFGIIISNSGVEAAGFSSYNSANVQRQRTCGPHSRPR